MKPYKIALIIISIGLILLLIFNSVNNNLSSNKVVKNTTIKVLIYDGDGTMETSVKGIEDSLNDSNNHNLEPNTHFEYTTTEKVNSNTLTGYDVLVMPGGNADEYLNDEDIDSSAIKQFVNNGKGYLGICAGAYAGSNYVDGYYAGWGLSDVNTENVNYEGLLNISTTSIGHNLTNGSLITIHHQNGPAMYTNNTNEIMATYEDNSTGYENYAAIVEDTYGSGRVILSGSHPELSPQDQLLLGNMLLWLSGN